ncbi:MAG: HAMP domain-containing sensor histidine kinase [Chitinophagaceae bacterium]
MSQPLLQKNTRTILTWLPVVLFICCILFYVVLEMHTHHMQEKQLQLKQYNVWNSFIKQPSNTARHITGEYDIDEGSFTDIDIDEPRDTAVYYTNRKKALPFKILTANFQLNGQDFHVTTYVSSTEVWHMTIKIFITEGVILILLLVTIVMLNNRGSKQLWKSFFLTMEEIKKYDIVRNQSLNLQAETGITEFDELNNVLDKLIKNVNAAYYQQKQFVENASHEMQTPLAIIRSKSELLINQPSLTEKNASLLGDITDATNRLSQMNRTLLLLAKIENNQFPETESIDVSRLLSKLLDDYKNHSEDFPEISGAIQEEVLLVANRSLIEVLFSNLVKNAIIHNQPNGKIKIALSEKSLMIENTGPVLEVNTAELFERFKKGSHATRTTGLGLSLVKQVCNLYHYSVSYKYHETWHSISVTFN